MIRTEPIPGSEDLVRTYSDRDMVIKQDQTGNKYIEAVDIIGIDLSGGSFLRMERT